MLGGGTDAHGVSAVSALIQAQLAKSAKDLSLDMNINQKK